MFVIPWESLIIGTTDTDWNLDLTPAATKADIDYILALSTPCWRPC